MAEGVSEGGVRRAVGGQEGGEVEDGEESSPTLAQAGAQGLYSTLRPPRGCSPLRWQQVFQNGTTTCHLLPPLRA